MKSCLNCLGAIALLVAFSSGIASAAFFFTTGTEAEAREAANNFWISIGIFLIAFLTVIVIFNYNSRRAKRNRAKTEERRHQEQLAALYQATANQPRPASPSNEDDLLIDRAKLLYQQGNIEACKALLRTMPNNPKAQKALMRIEQG